MTSREGSKPEATRLGRKGIRNVADSNVVAVLAIPVIVDTKRLSVSSKKWKNISSQFGASELTVSDRQKKVLYTRCAPLLPDANSVEWRLATGGAISIFECGSSAGGNC